MSSLNPLSNQSYISLVTYRRNGQGVQTPVWFAQNESDKYVYIWTESKSGKAKRIRNNPIVKLAPSNSRGNPKGEYLSANARVTEQDSPEYKTGVQLINKKYGVIKKVFDIFMNSNKPHCVIKLKIME